MAFISQTVAGAGQFTGLAGAGLLTFDLTGFDALIYVPRIYYLGIALDGAAAQITGTVGLSVTPAVNRCVLFDEVANSVVLTCPLTIGRTSVTTQQEITVTTVGKTATGVLECVWYPYNALTG